MTNIERQMWTVRNLEIPPRECCKITEFKVEEWDTGHVFVRRVYRPEHAPRLYYTEGFVIGPRGGQKTIYKHADCD